MFFLNLEKFTDYDLDDLTQFVNCWASYYRYSVKKMNFNGKISNAEIDYFSELNLNNDLSEENIVNLLRWKDPKYLSNKILSGPNQGGSNDRVYKVVKNLPQLNQFRNSKITSDELKKITGNIFPNGAIWEIFIFHICKPLCYPIADQHVFRSYSFHKNDRLKVKNCSSGWEKYEGYKKYFEEMVSVLYGELVAFDDNELLRKRKELDNALMAYGQFLKKYEKKG